MKKDYKKVILIDLDGVLNDYTGGFKPDYIPPIRDGARDFIKKLAQNFEIRLFTTRNKLLASKWLMENELDEFFSDITNVKDLCWFFIDDRCLKFDGDFQKMLLDIENFKTHWQNRQG